MKTFLTIGLALASLAGAAAAAQPQVRPDTVTRVDNDWRDCRSWDRHHHQCRDHDWDRNRWREREWYGHRTCRGDHDHYLDVWGRWRGCR